MYINLAKAKRRNNFRRREPEGESKFLNLDQSRWNRKQELHSNQSMMHFVFIGYSAGYSKIIIVL